MCRFKNYELNFTHTFNDKYNHLSLENITKNPIYWNIQTYDPQIKQKPKIILYFNRWMACYNSLGRREIET